jgi:DNA (cytosine-5)-methyltransferase 1
MLRCIQEVQPRWVVGENVLGLVNWSGGLVFHEVQADLEAEGYEVQPYVLPAVSVNAPHRRDRVWFVAYSNGIGLRRQGNGIRKSRFISKDSKRSNWQNFPTVSLLCNGDDGISDRLDSITFPKWRNESIKAGGNAIVPQVVLQIFKTIEQYERINTPDKNS